MTVYIDYCYENQKSEAGQRGRLLRQSFRRGNANLSGAGDRFAPVAKRKEEALMEQ